MASSTPALIVVMGTSGCGKSSIGLAVAQALGAPFVDGDDLHPAANVAKMSSGHPLNDDDRLPWLVTIRKTAQLLTRPASLLAHRSSETPQDLEQEVKDALTYVSAASKPHAREGERPAVVIGCSALKRTYRDILRGKPVAGSTTDTESELETYFIYLHGSRALLLSRMEARPSHFFKASMLDSQLETLELPMEKEEQNVRWVRLGKPEDDAKELGMAGVIKLAQTAAQEMLSGP